MERSLGVKDFKILTALEERVDEALTQLTSVVQKFVK